jgi:hypothetical protein
MRHMMRGVVRRRVRRNAALKSITEEEEGLAAVGGASSSPVACVFRVQPRVFRSTS